MAGFIANLDIAGKTFTFTANRQAKITQERLVANEVKNSGNVTPDIESVKNYVMYALLNEHHPDITMEISNKLREAALSPEEYGDKFDDFLVKMMEKCITVGKKHLSFFDKEE